MHGVFYPRSIPRVPDPRFCTRGPFPSGLQRTNTRQYVTGTGMKPARSRCWPRASPSRERGITWHRAHGDRSRFEERGDASSRTLRLLRFLRSDWLLFVDISYTRSYPLGGHTCGGHEALDDIDRRAGRLGPSRFEAFSNKQRGPSLLVGLLPDVDV